MDFKFGGRKKEVWKQIRETLEKTPMKTVESLRDVLYSLSEIAGTLKKKDQFEHLPSLFQQVKHIDPLLYERFFPVLLPKISEWARQFPSQFPDTVPILRTGDVGKVTLSDRQCVYLLSAAFFCILPEPATDGIQSLNFRKFYRNAENVASQSHKLCAVLRYFEHHIAQLKSPFEKEEGEEAEAFKERQKEFRQEIYSRWSMRTVTLQRSRVPTGYQKEMDFRKGKYPNATLSFEDIPPNWEKMAADEAAGGDGAGAGGNPEQPRHSSKQKNETKAAKAAKAAVPQDDMKELLIQELNSRWSKSKCPLSTEICFLDDTVDSIPPDWSKSVRLMEFQTSRYTGEFLGLGCDHMDSYFCEYLQAIAFLPFVERQDLTKEFLSVQGVQKTADMQGDGSGLRYIPRENGYGICNPSTNHNPFLNKDGEGAAGGDIAPATTAANGDNDIAPPPTCAPIECVSFSFEQLADQILAGSVNKTMMLDSIFTSIAMPRHNSLEEEQKKNESSGEEQKKNESSGDEEEEEKAREKKKDALKKMVDDFYPGNKKVIVMPPGFLQTLCNGNEEEVLQWTLLWWIVCCEAKVSELRIPKGKCRLKDYKRIEQLIQLLRNKNFTCGLLFNLIHDFNNTKAIQQVRTLSQHIDSLVKFGN